MVSAAFVGSVFDKQPSETTITYSKIDKNEMSAADYKNRSDEDDSLLLKEDNSEISLEEVLGDENCVTLEI